MTMKIIKDGKIDLQALRNFISRPEIFTTGTAKFWDDDHISGQMLKMHLNPDIEAASKTAATIAAEAAFIAETTGMGSGKTVLDLGCGPGLYVKKFAATGANITGIDLSARSINYANETIKPQYENANFIKMNYLNLDFRAAFDIATLIFYDFGALSTMEQERLLSRVHGALKDNGVFIFDVLSSNWRSPLATSIAVHEGGFWSPEPYIEILTTFTYDNPRTEGRQYTILSEDGDTKVFRLYFRLFTREEIIGLLARHNFTVENVYNNLHGDPLSPDTETYGIIARKAR